MNDRAEGAPPAGGDSGVFAFGIDHEHGAVGDQEIWDDGADALAGARRRDRQQVAWAGVIEQGALTGSWR